jgi:hypothetical protein
MRFSAAIQCYRFAGQPARSHAHKNQAFSRLAFALYLCLEKFWRGRLDVKRYVLMAFFLLEWVVMFRSTQSRQRIQERRRRSFPLCSLTNDSTTTGPPRLEWSEQRHRARKRHEPTPGDYVGTGLSGRGYLWPVNAWVRPAAGGDLCYQPPAAGPERVPLRLA